MRLACSLRQLQLGERVERFDPTVRQLARPAPRQVAWQLDVSELHLNYATDLQPATFE